MGMEWVPLLSPLVESLLLVPEPVGSLCLQCLLSKEEGIPHSTDSVKPQVGATLWPLCPPFARNQQTKELLLSSRQC